MSSGPGNPSSASGAPASTKTRARLDQLEDALRLVRAERRGQIAAVDDELRQLEGIYERMTSDLATLRDERDRAVEEARVERERRARETLDLTERLERATRRDDPAGAIASPEGFVQARLLGAPADRRGVAPGEMPTVPGYRLLAPLGQGGMATVYHAVCERDGLEVAVKILHDGPDADPTRLELFLREAAAMLQLSHPGLVRALDAGDCPHGRYLVLEYVRGESLASLVRRCGALPEREAIRIGLQVARALSYCARVGLTHRDVKPSNLLMDTSGRVRVCDFGLAALSYGSDSAGPYGSPGYAAPEQIHSPAAVDERGDVYSLGATLWHLVVGRRPFQGAAKHVFETQRTQDLADPRFEGADVSPRFAQVIRRMGRLQRERRYRRWDECILDLMLVENGNPPFSAHLADALEPGGAFGGGPDPTPPPFAGVQAAASQSASASQAASQSASQAAPASAGTGATTSATGRPPVRRVLAAAVVCAASAVGAAIGYGIARESDARSASHAARSRASGRASDDEIRAAAATLRASADAHAGAERERLLRLADALDGGTRK